jgi:hypothetical protein
MAVKPEVEVELSGLRCSPGLDVSLTPCPPCRPATASLATGAAPALMYVPLIRPLEAKPETGPISLPMDYACREPQPQNIIRIVLPPQEDPGGRHPPGLPDP